MMSDEVKDAGVLKLLHPRRFKKFFCFLLSPVFVAYLCFLEHDTKHRSRTKLMERFTTSRCLKTFPRYKRKTVTYEVFMFVPK